MAYALDIPAPLLALIEELPPRSCAAIFGVLEQMTLLAEVWERGDERWEQLARHDGEGLCFYVDGCCVRVELQREERRLVVREIGRVIVHLPAGHGFEANLLGSHVEQ